MSAAMDNLREDAHKAPEQLEREADSARDAVEGTLSELEHRLSPGQLVDRLMGMVKGHGSEFGNNLLAQVRNNPLPTLVTGIGVAWLIAASKQPPPRAAARPGNRVADGLGPPGWSLGRARDAAVSAADSAAGAASDAMDATTSAVHDTADAAAGFVRRAADATRDTAGKVKEASRTGAQSLTDGYAYLSREQPLVLCAIAVAAGAAVGALLPSTSTEDSWLGETSDAAMDRVKAAAESTVGGLREAAAATVDSAKAAVLGESEAG